MTSIFFTFCNTFQVIETYFPPPLHGCSCLACSYIDVIKWLDLFIHAEKRQRYGKENDLLLKI